MNSIPLKYFELHNWDERDVSLRHVVTALKVKHPEVFVKESTHELVRNTVLLAYIKAEIKAMYRNKELVDPQHDVRFKKSTDLIVRAPNLPTIRLGAVKQPK